MPYTWIERIGEAQTEFQRELEKFKQRFQGKDTPPPQRDSLEGLFPELRGVDFQGVRFPMSKPPKIPTISDRVTAPFPGMGQAERYQPLRIPTISDKVTAQPPQSLPPIPPVSEKGITQPPFQTTGEKLMEGFFPSVPTFSEWAKTKGFDMVEYGSMLRGRGVAEADIPEMLLTTQSDLKSVYEFEYGLGRWGTAAGELEKIAIAEPEKLLSVAKVFGQSLLEVPQQWQAARLQATQGLGGASVTDRDQADMIIKKAQEDIGKFAQKIAEEYPDSKLMEQFAQLPPSIAFSLTSMTAGGTVGLIIGIGGTAAATALAGPTGGASLAAIPFIRAAAWGAGSAASGVVAYNITSYQIMQQYLEMKNEEMIASRGSGITAAEEKQLKADFEAKAREYGLWEAVPEAISNLAFARLLTAPLTRIAGRVAATRIVGRVATMFGGELLTETVTQKGQSDIEVEIGWREGRITLWEAAQEIAPQTFLLTGILGGVGSVSVASVNKVKQSLKTEIGTDHPLYQPLLASINERLTEVLQQGAMEQGGVPKPTIESVAAKIMNQQPLTVEERQFYANQAQAVEDALKAQAPAITPKVAPTVGVEPVVAPTEEVTPEEAQLKKLGWSDSRIAELDEAERASILRNKITPESAKEVAPEVTEGVRDVQLPSGTMAEVIETEPGRVWQIKVRGEIAGELIQQYGKTTVFSGGESFNVASREEGFAKLQERASAHELGMIYRESPADRSAHDKAILRGEVTPPVTPEVTRAVPPARHAEVIPEKLQPAMEELTKMYDFWRNKVKTLEETKASLAKYVRENLPPSVRGKFVTSVARVKTDAQLETQMSRVREVAEQTESRRLRIEINKELKKAVTRKDAGIIKGRFGGEIQAEINAIKQSLTMSKDNAMTQIATNMKAYEAGSLAYEDMVEQNIILGNAGIKEMRVSELADTLAYIKSLKEAGRAGRLEQLEKFKKQMETDRDAVKNVITGGRPVKRGVVKEFNTSIGWFQKLINGQLALTDFMDKLSVYDKPSKPYASALSKFVDNRVTEARNAENEGLQSQQETIQKAFSDIFGTEKASDANNILRQMGREEVDIGTFKDLDGEEVNLVFTKGQMIDVYNLTKAPENLPTFVEGNRFTQKMQDSIINGLSAKEKEWADWMRTHLAGYWQSINDVYEPLYGVNLGRHENYWPRNRDIERGVISEQILLKQDFDHFASVNNRSLKARTDNKIPFEFLDANTKLLTHIQQMEHFKAWALPIRDMRSLFMNKDTRAAALQYHGAPILRKVDEFINDLARGGIEKAKIIAGLDKLRGNVTIAQLGLKPGPALKQPASLVAYATEMPTMDFIEGIAGYLRNPVKNYRTLRDKSPGLRARYRAGNWERDVKTAVTGGAPKSFSGKMGFSDYMLWLLKIGDKYSQTVPGMWAKYKSELKVPGTTDAEAIRAAEQSTNRTQVASYIETLSTIQRGGSLARLATMFQDQPAKYFRLINASARNMWGGRVSKKKGVLNIFILWVLAPALFQFMADGFKWEKERQMRAWLLGPLNDMLVIGQIAQSVFGWVQGEQYPYAISPVLEPFRDVQMAISKARKLYKQGVDPMEDISVEDVIALLEYVAKATGTAAGVPTPYFIQAEKAIRNREPKQFIWTEWALGEPSDTIEQYTKEWKDDITEYNLIPSNPIELEAAIRAGTVKYDRSEYRGRNPEVDAKLFISGQVTTVKTRKASDEVLRLVKENKLKPEEISAVRAWQKEEEKRQELGLRDENITLTDELIQRLLGITVRQAGESRYKPAGESRFEPSISPSTPSGGFTPTPRLDRPTVKLKPVGKWK